jgi:hypothetical protein
MNPYRIVLWGTGGVGRPALEAILDRPEFELVGHYVRGADKAGKDSGTFIGRPPVGITTTQDVEQLLALKPDVLAYFANAAARQPEVVGEMARFLEKGVNVVTASLSSVIAPEGMRADLRETLESACRRGGASIFATGIEPGFATGHLALTCLTVANRVEQVRLQEFADYSTYPDELTLRNYFGFGLPMDAPSPNRDGSGTREIWMGTLAEAAQTLGLTIDSYRTAYYAAPAAKDLDVAMGRIDKGTISAMWIQLIGVVGGQDRLFLEHINWMDLADIPPDWPAPPHYPGGTPRTVAYRIAVEGTPSFECEFKVKFKTKTEPNGLAITALHALNAVPYVVAAKPGFVFQSEFVPYGIKALV